MEQGLLSQGELAKGMWRETTVGLEDKPKTTRRRKIQLQIYMERQEREALRLEARRYDLNMTGFIMLIFRDWLVDRRPLRLVPPLPREPWEPKK